MSTASCYIFGYKLYTVEGFGECLAIFIANKLMLGVWCRNVSALITFKKIWDCQMADV